MIFTEIPKEFHLNIDSTLLKFTAETTLSTCRVDENLSLSIILTDNQSIQRLNHQYRGVDAPTDVLSFPGEHTNPEDGSFYLGDVVVSYPQAKSQAADRGHSEDDELQFLVVHGILHLLGYDHHTKLDKDKMWHIQNVIVKKLNLHIVIPQ